MLFFLLSTTSILTLVPTQTLIQRILRALSLGIKRQEHEADHSPPSSAEVKKVGAIPPFLSMSSRHNA
jgi:hypothetical protein